MYEHPSPKCCWKIIRSGCPASCPICKGREPGCPGLWERKPRNLHRYEESVDYAKERLGRENERQMTHLRFFRTLACLYYLRTFTFSFRVPAQVFFSLYDQNLTVQRNRHYPVIWVAFQNRLDEADVAACLKWKTEPRCVVLSQIQRKILMCLGGSTRLLAMLLVPNTQGCCRYLRFYILGRLFGQKTIHRLIRAGGLDPFVFTHQCRSEAYFGR